MMLLESLLLNAMVITGVKLATEEGMILHPLTKIPLPVWLRKPLYECVTCMASIWSVPVFAWFYGFGTLYVWPFYVLALAAVSTGVYGFIDRISK